MSLGERFWSKVLINEENPDGCWIWQNANRHGYGTFWYKRHNEGSHKLSFLAAGGILTTENPDVLHKCNVRSCVNPLHLEAGNDSKNQQYAATFKTKPTHCPQGHEYTVDNLDRYKLAKGDWVCRICKNEAVKLHLRKKRAK